jgi:hypothetical protein
MDFTVRLDIQVSVAVFEALAFSVATGVRTAGR